MENLLQEEVAQTAGLIANLLLTSLWSLSNSRTNWKLCFLESFR
jgi:hypothetical protein